MKDYPVFGMAVEDDIIRKNPAKHITEKQRIEKEVCKMDDLLTIFET